MLTALLLFPIGSMATAVGTACLAHAVLTEARRAFAERGGDR